MTNWHEDPIDRYTAIRFCLLVTAKQTQGTGNIAQVRQTLCNNSMDISFASKLWQVFRAVITETLDDLKAILGDVLALIMDAVNRT